MNNLAPRFLVAANSKACLRAHKYESSPTHLIAQTGQLNEAPLPGARATGYRVK